jgi:hypothetical protein
MPPALTPALALDYVRELSADVRAAVVLNATGVLLAGPPQLAAPARALLDAGAGVAELEIGNAHGVVCSVRSSAHAAVAVCGRYAIPGIVREDLRAALAALEGRPPDSVGPLVAVEGRPPDSVGPLVAVEGRPPDSVGPLVAVDPRLRDSRSAPERAAESAADDALLAAAAALISAAERGFDA